MYKYQSKCKFRMLTTIGDKIVEIRPKQIIESNTKLDNKFLSPLNKMSDPHYKREKKAKVENDKHTSKPPTNPKA